MCGFWMQNRDFWTGITSLYVSQTSPVALCLQYSVISPLTLRVPAFMFCFCMQNRDFWGRITSLYESQTSPVVLCIQNRVISITITSLYGSLPSSLDSGCKTATFGQEKKVSMSPRPHKSLCACKTA